MFLRPVVQPVVWPAHSHPRGPVGGGGVTSYPAKTGTYAQDFNALGTGTLLRSQTGWGAYSNAGAVVANDRDMWQVSATGTLETVGSWTITGSVGTYLTAYDLGAGKTDHVIQCKITKFTEAITLCVGGVDDKNTIYFRTEAGASSSINKIDATGAITISSWNWLSTPLGRALAVGDTIRLSTFGRGAFLEVNGLHIHPAGGWDIDTTRAFTKGTRAGFGQWNTETNAAGVDDLYIAPLVAHVEHASTSLVWANLANDGTSNVAGSFPIFWPGKVGQGRSVPLAFTYTGTVSDLDFRVVNGSTGALVLDWQRVPAGNRTLSAGNGTANVQVPMCDTTTNPTIRVEIRAANDVDAVARTPATAVGLCVGEYGQSNSVFRDSGNGASAATAYTRSNAYLWSSRQGKTWLGGVSGTGETFPGFMYAHTLAAITGIPCGVFIGGVGSQPLSKLIASDSTYQNGNGSTGVFWDDFLTEVQSKQCNADGLLSWVEWTQGEAESEQTSALNGTDVTAYRSNFDTLLSQLRGGRMVSATAPVGVCVIGQNTGAPASTTNAISDANWSLVRQTLYGLTDKTNVVVSAGLIDLAHPTGDTLHHTGDSYVEANRRGAHSAAKALGYSTYDGRGPFVTGATRSGATITLAVNLNGAASIAGTGLTNYEVSTDSFATTKTISSVAVSGSTIVITLSANPGAVVQVRSFSGHWPESVTGAVNPQDITSTRAIGTYADGSTIPVQAIYTALTSN